MELVQIIFSILTVAFVTTFILLSITYISYRIKEKKSSNSLQADFNSNLKLQPISINQSNQNSKRNSVNHSDVINSKKRFEILNNLNSSNDNKFEMMRFTIWKN